MSTSQQLRFGLAGIGLFALGAWVHGVFGAIGGLVLGVGLGVLRTIRDQRRAQRDRQV